MNFWKQLRVPLLVLTFANVLFVFGRSILDPNIGKREVIPFVFPVVVPLPQWQTVGSHPLKNQILDLPPYGKFVVHGMQYSYRQNSLPLDIEMRYEVATDGNVRELIKDGTPIHVSLAQPILVLRHHQGVGFYGLYVYQKRAYLDACINSRGGSSFNREQFSYNRIHYDLKLNRLLPWLFGQKELRDQRCLWAHFSIPLDQSLPDSSYHILETAWFSWYKLWLPHFPRP